LIDKDGCACRNIYIQFPCAYPTVVSSISGGSFHFPFPYFVLDLGKKFVKSLLIKDNVLKSNMMKNPTRMPKHFSSLKMINVVVVVSIAQAFRCFTSTILLPK
jgi:hypothetical protein